jgi:hypothetical protein
MKNIANKTRDFSKIGFFDFVFYKFCLFVDKILGFKNQTTHVNRKEFKDLFYKRESEAIVHKSGAYLQIFLIVLFLGVGFSLGVNKFAKKKLADPYSSFLTGEIKSRLNYSNLDFWERLQDSVYGFKNNCKAIKQVGFYKREDLMLKGDIRELPARTEFFQFDDPMLKSILDPVANKINCPRGDSFLSKTDNGLIVSWSIYNQLFPAPTDTIGISNWNKIEIRPFVQIRVKSFFYNIPIRAVVRELPGKDVLCIATHYLSKFNDFAFKNGTTAFDPQSEIKKTVLFKFRKDSSGLLKAVETYYPLEVPQAYISLISEEAIKDSVLNWPDYKEQLRNPNINLKSWTVENIAQTNDTNLDLQEITIKDFGQGHPIWRFFIDLSKINKCESFVRNTTKLTFNFPFDDKKSASNFSLMGSVAKLLAIVFAVIGFFIALTMVHIILENHLNSNKSNIGTLLAFGVDISGIYSNISFTILVIPSFIACIVSYLFGHIFNTFYLFMKLFGGADVEIDHYFTILSLWFLIPLLLLIVLNLFLSKRIIKRFIETPPGLLIYNKKKQNLENQPDFPNPKASTEYSMTD